MGTRLAVCRFSDGAHKYLLYSSTVDVALLPLFHTAEAAYAWSNAPDSELEHCAAAEFEKEETVLVWAYPKHALQPELLDENDAFESFALRGAMRLTGDLSLFGPEGMDCCCISWSNCHCEQERAREEARGERADKNAEANADARPIHAAFTVYPRAQVMEAHAAAQGGLATPMQTQLARALREGIGAGTNAQPPEENDFVFCCEEIHKAEYGDGLVTSFKAFIIGAAAGGEPIALAVAFEDASQFASLSQFHKRIPDLARDANCESERSLHGLVPLNALCRLPREDAWHTPADEIVRRLLRAAYLDESGKAMKESETLAAVVAEVKLSAENTPNEFSAARVVGAARAPIRI